MKNIYIILFTILVFSCKTVNTVGQANKINKQAEIKYNRATEYLFEKKIDAAIEQLEEAIKIEPEYFQAYLKLAELIQNSKLNYTEAIELYKKIDSFEPNNYKVLYNKATCFFKLRKFEEAKNSISTFLENENIQGANRARAEQILRNIIFSSENPIENSNITFENLGSEVNSVHNEYFPSITPDNVSLFYTVKEIDNPYANEDIYEIKFQDGKWNKRKKISEAVNTKMNEGAHCISSSGKYLLFSSDNYINENIGRFDIYISKKVGEEWNRPKNMGRNINSRTWDSQPVLSSDSKELYFVSAKSGGNGGSDIYVSTIGEDGRFGEAKNIGDIINTPFDEQRPYIHPDGKTLYFASGGHAGFGGSDLYKSTRDDNGNWSKPINLGAPINSSNDEFGVFVAADGKKAYISSDRKGGYGGQDIYSFEMPEELKPMLVNYIKGIVSESGASSKLKANIRIYDLETKLLVKSFGSDEINGEFLSTINAGKDYAFEVLAEGYLPFSENISLKKLENNEDFVFNVALQKIEVGKEIVLKNIFFNTAEYNLLDKSLLELEHFIEFLNKNSKLKIEIGGHTDNVGSSNSNLILSEKRAQAVMNFLMEKGISSSRMTFKGFGDTLPIADNNTEKGKSQNRRTSFKIIQK